MPLSFKDGAYACIPTLLGYIGIGIAAGIVGKSANLSVLEITLLAIIVYAARCAIYYCWINDSSYAYFGNYFYCFFS